MTEFELSRVNRQQTQLETWRMSTLNSGRGEKLWAECAGSEGSQGQACGRRAQHCASLLEAPHGRSQPRFTLQSPGHFGEQSAGMSRQTAQFPLMGKLSLLL